ncbi:hypothetical protein [Coralloluteibacterium thermophilus]|uniref:TetR family transcriptional regulator n=1 Tax=Coralloluteibacterium thermophilum TaxID=2707049 RepID=A0ABV9NKZ7_9GAMM
MAPAVQWLVGSILMQGVPPASLARMRDMRRRLLLGLLAPRAVAGGGA